MIMWIVIIIGAVIVIMLGLYLYLAYTCFFTPLTFMINYDAIYKQTGSKRDTLRSAMAVFAYRPPFSIFSILTASDIDRLVDICENAKSPHMVAQLFREVDRKKDASRLIDEKFLMKLEKLYTATKEI